MSFPEKKSESSKPLHAFVRFMARKLRSTYAVTGCHVLTHPNELPKTLTVPNNLTVHAFDQAMPPGLALPPASLRLLFTKDDSTASQLAMRTSPIDILIFAHKDENDHPSIMHRVLRATSAIVHQQKIPLDFTRWGSKKLQASGVDDLITSLQPLHLNRYVSRALSETLSALKPIQGNLSPTISLSSDGNLLQVHTTIPRAIDEQTLTLIMAQMTSTTLVIHNDQSTELVFIWAQQNRFFTTTNKVFMSINAALITQRTKTNDMSEAI